MRENARRRGGLPRPAQFEKRGGLGWNSGVGSPGVQIENLIRRETSQRLEAGAETLELVHLLRREFGGPRIQESFDVIRTAAVEIQSRLALFHIFPNPVKREVH